MEVIVGSDCDMAKSYLFHLTQLTDNRMIHVLTMLADENIKYGLTIANTIVQRLDEVTPQLKLPHLYLIDSIVKNIGGIYIVHFSKSIASIFIAAFEMVNESTREKMLELRETWNGIFPRTELNKIDSNVKRSILKRRHQDENFVLNIQNKKKMKPDINELSFSEADVDWRLLQSPFCDAQRKEIISDIEHVKHSPWSTHMRISPEGKRNPHTNVQNHSERYHEVSNRGQRKSYPIKQNAPYEKRKKQQYKPSQNVGLQKSDNFRQFQIVKQPGKNYPLQQDGRVLICQQFSSNPTHLSSANMNWQKTADQLSASQSNHISNKLNVNELLQKLLKFSQQEKPSLGCNASLKRPNISAVHALYSGWQCSSCGIRFPIGETSTHRDHLDWHFQQNRKDKHATNDKQSRNWYISAENWTQNVYLEDLVEKKPNLPAIEVSKNRPEPKCVANRDEFQKDCNMCGDPFELFYDNDDEEWYLRNAIRFAQGVYHPICYADLFKESSDIKSKDMFLIQSATELEEVNMPISNNDSLKSNKSVTQVDIFKDIDNTLDNIQVEIQKPLNEGENILIENIVKLNENKMNKVSSSSNENVV